MIIGKEHGKVWIDGEILLPNESLKLINHSPSGFSWGYLGSGPSQLALALLLHFTDAEFAQEYYMEFKEDVIASLPQGEFALEEETVQAWIADRQCGHQMVELGRCVGCGAQTS